MTRLPTRRPMSAPVMGPKWSRTRAICAAALALLLAACIFAPGKFTSELGIRKDRTFSFRYTGEIVLVPLMKQDAQAAFAPEACHDEQTGDEQTSEERPCTAAELSTQKSDWDRQQAEKRKSDTEAAQMLLGGIDPGNPESGKELAAKIRRQAGWNKVEYLGDGKFDVDFAITGKLDHDFVFPTFEGFPMSNAFVQVYARRDGTVRIDAPGFGPQAGSAAMSGMMSGMKPTGGDDTSNLADGTFTIVTQGEVLANNTDEGPRAAPGGKALAWKVNPRTPAAPTALIRLAP